jgi:hypothetical protein
MLQSAKLLLHEVWGIQPMIMALLPVLLASAIRYDFTNRSVPEAVAKECAREVNIPYASGSFTGAEWRKFQRCIIKRTNL